MTSRRTLLLSAAALLGAPALSRVADGSPRGKPLVLAVGLSLPPYVIAEKRRGMEYDVVKEALALAGWELVPRFVEFAQASRLLRDGYVDGALTMQTTSGVDARYSAVYVTYHNFAMTLARRRIAIARVADLAGRTILAFQDARDYLGPDFARITAGNPGYHEVAEQYRQNLALLEGRVEVVVADRNIFRWYAHDPRVTRAGGAGQAITYHDIFEPTPYRIGFRYEAVRDAFDAALARLRASGRYDAIVREYATFTR